MSKEKQDSKEVFLQNFKAQHPKPYFNFINLSPTERLHFELLDGHNYTAIHTMFSNDDSPYLLAEYKNLEKLQEYIQYHLQYNRYSPKRAACDWLIKLKSTNEYIGLLNLYDLSLETFNDNHQKCMVGFHIKASHRRKYYALEALNQLIQHCFEHFEMQKIIANVEKENTASQNLLTKTGFTNQTEKYLYSKQYDYFEFEKTELLNSSK